MCRRRFSSYRALLWKNLHLQYNVIVIYDESKAVSHRPLLNKVPPKMHQTDRGTPHSEA